MKDFDTWCVLRNETSKGNLLAYCSTFILVQASKLEEAWSAVPFLGVSYHKTDDKKWAKKSYCQHFFGTILA